MVTNVVDLDFQIPPRALAPINSDESFLFPDPLPPADIDDASPPPAHPHPSFVPTHPPRIRDYSRMSERNRAIRSAYDVSPEFGLAVLQGLHGIDSREVRNRKRTMLVAVLLVILLDALVLFGAHFLDGIR